MPTVEDLGADETADSSNPTETPKLDIHAGTPPEEGGPLGAPGSFPRGPPVRPVEDEDDDDEELEESMMERIWGLGEMFPNCVRNATYNVSTFSFGTAKMLYSVGRVVTWVVASSAVILALPVMFETERSQMEEQQLAQQRQILLGPNAAMSGGSGMMPQMMPPPSSAR